MLRKRTRSYQKDQQMVSLAMYDSGSDSHFLGYNHKKNSSLTVPGLLVGFSPKGISDCDSVRSPTSPLDFRFSNLADSCRSPRITNNGHHKSWDSCKVGLSILNSLDDDVIKESGKIFRSSESKNILFGQRASIKTPTFETSADCFEAARSLPRNFANFPRTHTKPRLRKGSSDVTFEIGEVPLEPDYFGKIRSCSLDSCKSFLTLSRLASRNSNADSGNFPSNNLTTWISSPLQFSGVSPSTNNSLPLDLNRTSTSVGSACGFVGALSAGEIELSEDYTCVISHGPNPKKTHIYGDCILECFPNEEMETILPRANASLITASPFPSNDFLNFCYHCNKKLDSGKDIYMYRGEKAFCSSNCRSKEIMMDEEMEKTINRFSDDHPKSCNGEELFDNGFFDAP